MADNDSISRHSKTLAVITPTYNSSDYIQICVKSVDSQSVKPLEHIIIDGKSSDNTIKLIKTAQYRKILSEKDRGIYDAMNKGFSLSTADYIIVLNSDDYFNNDNVIKNILSELEKNNYPELLCGGIEYIKRVSNKKVRVYKSTGIDFSSFLTGIAPPHPGVVISRSLFQELGGFNLDFKIASDFDLLLRAFKKKTVRIIITDLITTKMRTGGASDQNFRAHIQGLKEKRASILNAGYSFSYTKFIEGYFLKLLQLGSR